MARKIAISTNKGGVLKTSIATNLAGILSKRGRVLIVDLDNQGNVALSFGHNADNFKKTVYDVMVYGFDVRRAIVNVHNNIDILPSNDDMTEFEFEILPNLEFHKQPFKLLKKHLLAIEDDYDYIIIDTSPSLGLTQGNALAYVDEVIIPFQPENYSMRSLVKILKTINKFGREHNPKLRALGVVATLVDSRTTLHSEVIQQCRRFCDSNNIRMFDATIPKTIRYATSVAYDRLPATLTTKNKNLVKSYYDLMEEIDNE